MLFCIAYMEEKNPIIFYTATILEWKHLLKKDKYKQIITDSLKFCVEQQRVRVLDLWLCLTTFICCGNECLVVSNVILAKWFRRYWITFTTIRVLRNGNLLQHPKNIIFLLQDFILKGKMIGDFWLTIQTTMDDTFTLPYTPAGENTRQGRERVNLFERKCKSNKT